jgi:uncharacterized membrane protein YgcG
MDAYELHEARLLQQYTQTTAANALYGGSPVVPAGKVWTILSAAYNPSVSETQVVWFSIYNSQSTRTYPITVPLSMALTTVIPHAGLTEGMEIKLYPGEALWIQRGAATAGSTMSFAMRYIETDLPFYSYEEPQNKVVRQVQKHGSVFRRSGGISPGGSGGGSGEGHGGVPSGGGGPEPV